ncbi:MAG TPA: universal stress protein [Chitinophagaceae bacterium]|nr:universal stress protein [Chitinophagaceae bacterium]
MKTILIATDFSAASRNASLYGIALAHSLNAKVILLSAYQVPSPMPSLNLSISTYGVMKDAEQKLEEEARIIMQDSTIPIEQIIEHDSAENGINNIAKEKNADFIVVGMKGSGKNFKKIFGSTASALANSTGVPLIVVPEDAKFSSPKIIVFASDIDIETDLHSLDILIKIIQLFKSKLYVVKVVKNENEKWLAVADTSQVLRKAVEILDASFEYPEDTDITHALNKFIKKYNAEMLVMMPHKHEWAELLFTKSETKDMIFHTHIPLLVLPEKKFN